jgi:hypothetical protein
MLLKKIPILLINKVNEIIKLKIAYIYLFKYYKFIKKII